MARPHPSTPSGGSFYGPPPIQLSTWHQRGQRHYLPPGQITVSPGEAWKQAESDDSAIVGLIRDRDDRAYREPIKDFVHWCQLNARKAKELVVNFHRHKQPCTQVNTQRADTEIVTSYKCLGIHMDNKLDWTDHTAATYKEGQCRHHLLTKLRSFSVQGAFLTSFYDSVVASAIVYSVVCWSSSISAAGRIGLDKLVKKASSILGCPLAPVQVVKDSRIMDKLSSLLVQESHHLQVTLTALGSSFSNELIHPKCVKERHRRAFIPAAVSTTAGSIQTRKFVLVCGFFLEFILAILFLTFLITLFIFYYCYCFLKQYCHFAAVAKKFPICGTIKVC